MADVARALADDHRLTAWRNECYAVANEFGALPWFELERAAARYFGVRTYAAHVNGLIRLRNGDVAMWIARRSAAKAIDPGMLDNLVGGGTITLRTGSSGTMSVGTGRTINIVSTRGLTLGSRVVWSGNTPITCAGYTSTQLTGCYWSSTPSTKATTCRRRTRRPWRGWTM